MGALAALTRFQGARRGRRSHAPHFAPLRGWTLCWFATSAGQARARGVSPERGDASVPLLLGHPVPARDLPFTFLVKVAGSRCCRSSPFYPAASASSLGRKAYCPGSPIKGSHSHPGLRAQRSPFPGRLGGPPPKPPLPWGSPKESRPSRGSRAEGTQLVLLTVTHPGRNAG